MAPQRKPRGGGGADVPSTEPARRSTRSRRQLIVEIPVRTIPADPEPQPRQRPSVEATDFQASTPSASTSKRGRGKGRIGRPGAKPFAPRMAPRPEEAPVAPAEHPASPTMPQRGRGGLGQGRGSRGSLSRSRGDTRQARRGRGAALVGSDDGHARGEPDSIILSSDSDSAQNEQPFVTMDSGGDWLAASERQAVVVKATPSPEIQIIGATSSPPVVGPSPPIVIRQSPDNKASKSRNSQIQGSVPVLERPHRVGIKSQGPLNQVVPSTNPSNSSRPFENQRLPSIQDGQPAHVDTSSEIPDRQSAHVSASFEIPDSQMVEGTTLEIQDRQPIEGTTTLVNHHKPQAYGNNFKEIQDSQPVEGDTSFETRDRPRGDGDTSFEIQDRQPVPGESSFEFPSFHSALDRQPVKDGAGTRKKGGRSHDKDKMEVDDQDEQDDSDDYRPGSSSSSSSTSSSSPVADDPSSDGPQGNSNNASDTDPFVMLTFSVQRANDAHPQGYQLRFYDSWLNMDRGKVVSFNFGHEPSGPPDPHLSGIREGGIRRPGQPRAQTSLLTDRPMRGVGSSSTAGPLTRARKRGRDVIDEAGNEDEHRQRAGRRPKRPRSCDDTTAHVRDGSVAYLNETDEPEPQYAVHLGRILLYHDPRSASAPGGVSGPVQRTLNEESYPDNSPRVVERISVSRSIDRRHTRRSSIWSLIPGLQSLCRKIGGAFGSALGNLSSVATKLLNLPSEAWTRVVNLAFRMLDPDEGKPLRTGALIIALAIGVYFWHHPGIIKPSTMDLDLFEQSDMMFQLYSSIPSVLLFGDLEVVNNVRATYDLGLQLNLGGLQDGPVESINTASPPTTTTAKISAPWDVNTAGDYVGENNFVTDLLDASEHMFASRTLSLAKWFVHPDYSTCRRDTDIDVSSAAARYSHPYCRRFDVPEDIRNTTSILRGRVTTALSDFRREHNKLMNNMRLPERNSMSMIQDHLRSRQEVLRRIQVEAAIESRDQATMSSDTRSLSNLLFCSYGPLAAVSYALNQNFNDTAQDLLTAISCHTTPDTTVHERLDPNRCQRFPSLPKVHFEHSLPDYRVKLQSLTHMLHDFLSELRGVSQQLRSVITDMDMIPDTNPETGKVSSWSWSQQECQWPEVGGPELRACTLREMDIMMKFLEDVALPRLRQMDNRASMAARILSDAENTRAVIQEKYLRLGNSSSSPLSLSWWTHWIEWMKVGGFGFELPAFPSTRALTDEAETVLLRTNQARRLLQARMEDLAKMGEASSSYSLPRRTADAWFGDCVAECVPACSHVIRYEESTPGFSTRVSGLARLWRRFRGA